jgi:2-methylcitrate dehydratase PrpD
MDAAHGLSLEDLLESFAADTAFMPAGASPVCAARDLPRALLRFVRPGARNEAWRAWSHEHRIWFVTGRLSPADAATADGAVVHVFFYNQMGNLL